MAQPEARLRARVRLYLDAHLPSPGYWSAVEAGRKHAGTAEQRAREWQRLAAQGVKTGVADLFIVYRGRFLWVELKAGRNTTSEAQDAFARDMVANGARCWTIRSVTELHDRLHAEGVPVGVMARLMAEGHDRALAAETPVKPRQPGAKPRKPRPFANALRVAALAVKP